MDRVTGGTSGCDVFISYSHAPDGALAPALQTGVERFAKPWYRSRALRVFRDSGQVSEVQPELELTRCLPVGYRKAPRNMVYDANQSRLASCDATAANSYHTKVAGRPD